MKIMKKNILFGVVCLSLIHIWFNEEGDECPITDDITGWGISLFRRKAVSYTHLDVYKRQRLCSMHCRMC